MELALDGGTPMIIASGQLGPGNLAVNSTHAYWISTDSVMTVQLDGGGLATLWTSPSGGSLSALTTDSTSIYVIANNTTNSDGSVMKMQLDGGNPVPLASGQIYGEGLAVDSNYLYFLQAIPSKGCPCNVMKVLLDGGGLTTLAASQSAYSFAVDSTSLYWTVFSVGGSIMKVQLDGGNLTTLAPNQDSPYDLVVDSTNIYWTNANNGSGVGEVMKAGLNGECLTTLAAGAIAPGGIAMDATSVYWTNGSGPAHGSGRAIVKLTPK